VLYELVTGERLFDGETLSHTLAGVLKDEPNLNNVPHRVRRLLRSVLQKDSRRSAANDLNLSQFASRENALNSTGVRSGALHRELDRRTAAPPPVVDPP
jgi:hypothetical protein